MRYLSLCSGIEAATVAWKPLGWTAVGFSEIEPFPCSVLSHHYPDVPNLGNMLEITSEQIERVGPVDLLVGGTPCQSFSIAGLRGGLADARGNLALRYCQLLACARPRWFVWENVPGVLSSNKGRDFGAIVGAMAELGYGWAYRVLDAVHLGAKVPRDRVFVVGYSGDWRPPAAVLFEQESLARDQASPGVQRENTEGSPAVLTRKGAMARDDRENCILDGTMLRTSTPLEHERAMGFEDNYTLVPHRGRPAADGPRYKAIGNSMAVPVMTWIGKRIAQVDKLGKGP